MTLQTTTDTCCGGTAVLSSIGETDARPTEPSDDARLKELVKDRYARSATGKASCGCGCSGDAVEQVSFVGDEYFGKDGYLAEADLGLGCGIPTDIAGLREGETVLDLGSGAGIDAFIAARHVGDAGEVIGVDFTPEMVALAKTNATKLGASNVRFLLGDIEDLPLPQKSIDIIISNCVLNLVPDKSRAFAGMFRVLRPGGRFAVSDIVVLGELPDRLRASAALYAGCVSGAIGREDYLTRLREAGFADVEIARERTISVPDEVLLQVASREEVDAFTRSGGLASITVTGVRPE